MVEELWWWRKEFPFWKKVCPETDLTSWDWWLDGKIRLVWEPERDDCNNPVTRCPSLPLWLWCPGASSQLEEGLMACCYCATPEGDEEVSGHPCWRLSGCLERFSVLSPETAGKVLANGPHWKRVRPIYADFHLRPSLFCWRSGTAETLYCLFLCGQDLVLGRLNRS